MFRRSRLWQAAASVFTFVNIGGAGYAIALGEEVHAAVHGGLTLLGAALLWRLSAAVPPSQRMQLRASDERLDQLQQSIDAVAIEVERIGEAQRFNAKLQQEHVQPRH